MNLIFGEVAFCQLRRAQQLIQPERELAGLSSSTCLYRRFVAPG